MLLMYTGFKPRQTDRRTYTCFTLTAVVVASVTVTRLSIVAARRAVPLQPSHLLPTQAIADAWG